ncbi:MAG TPA: prealbumin-like fold domain-containing protein [Thermomicrobiales bacterium]|nr:prealbumin-like fold domain-containing protein [Thermomicrobiales bacterium]
MDYPDFDRFTRAMTSGTSRRSVLRRVVASAIASPMGFFGIATARADGNPDDKNKDNKKKKDKDSNDDKGRNNSDVSVNASGGVATSSSQSTQTVVNANNQVCAGNCAQTNQQVVTMDTTQTTLAGSQEFFGTPPTYWIDVVCTFDAPLYRTICDCTGHGVAGAPPVRKITIPPADICAFVISEETSVVRERERNRGGGGQASGGQASAGTGGVANADASGGSVTIGDVGGDDVNVAIDASGGTASADASGGDNNVAIAGGGQAGDDNTQVVELSKLTLELEGNVVPGRQTTYWVDTDSGRRPASGPALVQVAEETENSGAIIAEAKMCEIPQPQQGFDWFGQCTAPVTGMSFSLYPEGGASTPLATSDTNAQGRARFGNLPPGTYQLKPEGALGSESMIWCYAESDRVDANGNIIVEADAESHVWSFTCNASG